MKIAFLNIYQGLVERGAERVIEELSGRFKKKHTVKIFQGDSLPPKRWPILWRFFIDLQGIYIFWFTLKILPQIIKGRFDIVIPTNGGWQPAIIRLVTWLTGRKMVIIGHSGIGWDEKNNLWSFPDTFVAPSSFSEKWAKKVNPFVKIRHISNGVDINKFSPKGSHINNLKLEHPVILCVGALSPEKRLDLAISAVSELRKGSLIIVGTGQLKGELLEKGKELLGARFALSESTFEEIPAYYRIADVFTAPTSPWQSFEIVILEAMATNLPVVVNDDPIRREIVGDVGIFVDPEDSKNYAKALEKALQTNWGDKPRKQAEKFSWEDISSAYQKLFDSLIR